VRELAATTRHEADFRHPAPPHVDVPVVGRVPRVARLLAFAHHLDAQIRAGVYDDMADAARKLALTRARVSQLMSLLMLAPSIQEALLALPPILSGRDPTNERVLRPIAAEPVWERQVADWQNRHRENRRRG
jgi:hypothetical protein